MIETVPLTPQSHETLQPGSAYMDAKNGVMLDMAMPDLGQNGLMAKINVGDSTLGVYRFPGSEDMVLLTAPDFDYEQFTSQITDNAIRQNFMVLQSGNGLTIGRTERGAGILGISEDKLVSRKQASISFQDNKLKINDEESSNGTLVEVSEEAMQREQAIKMIGDSAVSHELIKNHEFQVGGVWYKVTGKANGLRDVISVSSIDETGKQRNFAVYNSLSEGNLRVTQGLAKYGEGGKKSAYLKGSELSRANTYSQYTQETQLNPEFAEKLKLASEGLDNDAHVPIFEVDQDIEPSQDFADQLKTWTFPDGQLAGYLLKVKAGGLSKDQLEHDLGQGANLDDYVNNLNGLLARADVIPDFNSQPTKVTTSVHPKLGQVVGEVYERGGIEWHIAAAQGGQVWIDRIRIKGTEATAYGTDKNLIFSGILTSKPMDYSKQVDAVDPKYRKPVDRYEDISSFLATLEPVKRYIEVRLNAR